MNQDSWNRSLPSEILLGGIRRFNPPLFDPTQSWLVSTRKSSPTSLGVRSQSRGNQDGINLQVEYLKGHLVDSTPAVFPVPPILDFFSWDWLEFHYHPLQDLAVKTILWVPDPRLICGVHRTHNQDTRDREITLKLTCQGEVKGTVHLSSQTLQGRNILTGNSKHHNLVLFLSGDARHTTGQDNQLISTRIIEPDETFEIRWVLACCSPNFDPQVYVDEIIQLDWDGEIARRKILRHNQLGIKTGNSDWDFSLAFSQRQALLILNQHLLQVENSSQSEQTLTPFQIWQLILALSPLDPIHLDALLQAIFGKQGEEKLLLPLLTEILWRAGQAGSPLDALSSFLPFIEKNLNRWFSLENDKDQDGIPEEPWDMLSNLTNTPDHMEVHRKDHPAGTYLEHPGVAALLYNEINQLIKLEKMVPDPSVPVERNQKKRLLKQFILDSWLEEKDQFQTREYQSHLSNAEFPIPGPFQNGWNTLNINLPYPSRLTLQLSRSADLDFHEGPLVTFHGMDWKGRYRIEEMYGADFHWKEINGWGMTRSIFSRIDHCVLAEGIQNRHLILKTPRTDWQDLSLTLPLWMDELSREIGEHLVSKSLTGRAGFWSDYGLKSYPGRDPGLISLPLNLLATQGLLRSGFAKLAQEIFFCWVEAVSTNLLEKGSLYSSWDGKTGVGVGNVNQVEGLLPIKLLLDLLEVRFVGLKEMVLEAKSPNLFPVQLVYRGVEITIKEKETRIVRPEGEEILYPRGLEAVIHF